MEGITHLRLPTLSHCPPVLLSLTHPLISATRDTTTVVKTVAQNPAVLAGWLG